jgi:DNA-binding transcriptional regulator LsrR (DeoR family)
MGDDIRMWAVFERGDGEALLSDESARQALDEWANLTVLVAGIGSVAPSPLLKDSGNAVSLGELDALSAAGAVGDICLHFFDIEGQLVKTDFANRTVGIDNETMRAIPRKVGVAGGPRKHEAIRAALRGGWLDVVITDVNTARWLMEDVAASKAA